MVNYFCREKATAKDRFHYKTMFGDVSGLGCIGMIWPEKVSVAGKHRRSAGPARVISPLLRLALRTDHYPAITKNLSDMPTIRGHQPRNGSDRHPGRIV